MKFLDKLTSKFAIPFFLGLTLILITVLFSRLYLEIFSTQKVSSFEKQSISEIGNRNTVAISYKLSQLEAEYNTSCILASYNEVTFFKGNLIEQRECYPSFFRLKKILEVGKNDLIKIEFLFDMPKELKFGFYMFLFFEMLILFAIGFAASKFERDRANGYFAFNTLARRAAHDIRAPLTALNSLLFNFQNQNDSRSDLLKSTIQSMNSIAEDLLTFNKISNYTKSNQEVALEDLISQVIFEKEQVLKSEIRKIDFHFKKESKTLIGCQIELYRIFSNILQNSIEAIPKEGVIKIEIAKIGKFVTISISDNGEGIPSEVLKKIGTEEITTKVSGNGLGLFYAKKTVMSLSGQFSIHSQREFGTTILIKIPL